jgi:hypothetical protein
MSELIALSFAKILSAPRKVQPFHREPDVALDQDSLSDGKGLFLGRTYARHGPTHI